MTRAPWLLLPLLLAGCLLPQPDTPILPPFMDGRLQQPEAGTAPVVAPVAAPTSGEAPGSAQAASVAIEAPGEVLSLEAELPGTDGAEPVTLPFAKGEDGLWRAALPAGTASATLLVKLAGQTGRVPLEAAPDAGERRLVLKREAGGWTLTEAPAPEAASPEPTPRP